LAKFSIFHVRTVKVESLDIVEIDFLLALLLKISSAQEIIKNEINGIKFLIIFN
tara:strand:+ start:417 stop:578 length:162 start_codon:yes stop_codon:yes gene_type:complete